MYKTIGIIPARYASTRFPGKPLALLKGKPMIQWTYEAVKKASKLDEVYVATDDQRISDVVEAFGGKVIMTGECMTGSDRCYQAVMKLTDKDKDKLDIIIVNIQGDEPLVNPDHINLLAEQAQTTLSQQVSNDVFVALASPIDNEEDVRSLATTKVVMDRNNKALYFSRAMIPHSKSGGYNPEVTYYKNCGMYAYSLTTLKKFANLEPGKLQLEEDLEQLKLMEYGIAIQMVVVNHAELGVDFPEQLYMLNKNMNNL